MQRFGNVKLARSGGTGGGGGVCLCVHTCVRERNLFQMLKQLSATKPGDGLSSQPAFAFFFMLQNIHFGGSSASKLFM